MTQKYFETVGLSSNAHSDGPELSTGIWLYNQIFNPNEPERQESVGRQTLVF